jgi:hypothetical protein
MLVPGARLIKARRSKHGFHFESKYRMVTKWLKKLRKIRLSETATLRLMP